MIEAFGAFLGSLVGLLAILCGAMLNAKLNRQRDDRLYKSEQQALAAALRGELLAIRKRVAWRYWAFKMDEEKRGEKHRHIGNNSRPKWDWTIPDRYVFRNNLDKLLLLDKNLVVDVIDTYEKIDDYATALQFSYQRGPTTKWVKHILFCVFDQCTCTLNLLANMEGLNLPQEQESIEVIGKREHEKLIPSSLVNHENKVEQEEVPSTISDVESRLS